MSVFHIGQVEESCAGSVSGPVPGRSSPRVALRRGIREGGFALSRRLFLLCLSALRHFKVFLSGSRFGLEPVLNPQKSNMAAMKKGMKSAEAMNTSKKAAPEE